jgi:hypothetical protein
LTVFTHPHKTGVTVDKEVMIASRTDSTPITVTEINIATEIIPAHSIGTGGYLVFDFFATRTGSASNVLLLFSLDGVGFYTDTMLIGVDSLQSRFILYANKLTATLKAASPQSVVFSPYYKGLIATQIVIDVDINIDLALTMGAVIFESPDTFTLEGYSIRTFNPSTSKNIISGKAQ